MLKENLLENQESEAKEEIQSYKSLVVEANERFNNAMKINDRKDFDCDMFVQELYINPLVWVNTTVYDFKNQLKTGAMTLYMWTYVEDIQTDDLLHPLGTVVSNPNVQHTTTLTLTFHRYHLERTVMYPSLETVLQFAAANSETSLDAPLVNQPNLYLEQLLSMQEKDPLHELHEQERKTIWSMRYDCLERIPNLLPKLLDCVEWNDHREVSEVTALLQKWPKLPVEKALELLDYAYADQFVRSFAVRCLQDARLFLQYSCIFSMFCTMDCYIKFVIQVSEVSEVTALLQKWPKLPVEKALELLDYAYADQFVRSFAVRCLQDASDDDVSLYLLQLVQALKHESYLSCDLVEFLLRRALNNQMIGHYLFWHLRSEMQVSSVSVRFGLILEAYCRGSQEHMKGLAKQVTCLEKLKATGEMVRTRKDKDKARSFLQEHLEEKHIEESFFKVLNPLNPSFRCKSVRTEKCRVMDSKMRPLWIVFENDDPYGDDIFIIFKNGDDLRQDMLTLQMIRIMDKLWKNEGLDLKTEKCRVMDSKMRPLWIVFENDDPYGDDIFIIFKNGDDLRQDMLTLQMIRIMDKLWKNEGLDL
ncbi:unnamed protein product, partial [Timema podura]|nr:unnamed protein product [Timema podura]